MSAESEAHEFLEEVRGRAREGRRQTADIHAMPRREQVLAAQQARSKLSDRERRSFRQRLRDAVDAFQA
jgi:uncharacterized membrane protein